MATTNHTTSGISVEQVGQRLYVTGNTYAVKDALKAAGCHWDGERRQWWIGAAKRSRIESLIAKPMPASQDVAAERLERDRENIIGRAEYDGHSYYLVGEGSNDRGAWVRLMFRDGSKTFFKPASEARVTKRYGKPQTLDGLREYAERMKREAAGGPCECWCHRSHHCTCGSGFCSFHHDGCDSCGCEN
jgi:hypothetical protein